MPKRVTRSSLNEDAVVVVYSKEGEVKQYRDAPPKKSRQQSMANFFHKRDQRTVDSAVVTRVKQETVDDIDSQSICQWMLNIKKSTETCDKVFESPYLLMQHLMNDHKKDGVSKYYYCHWKNCSACRSTQCFKSILSFKEHLRPHTECTKMPIPYFGNGTCDSSDSGDDNVVVDDSCEDKDYATSNASSDSDYSPAKEATSSKLKKRKALSPKTTTKKFCREPMFSTKSQSQSQPSSGRSQIVASTLTGYKFTCMWVVPLHIPSQGNSLQAVTCSRKYTDYDESIRHMEGHHVNSLLKKKMPWKCYWKNCKLMSKVFETIDDLLKHVRIHADLVLTYGIDSSTIIDLTKQVAKSDGNESNRNETTEQLKPLPCIVHKDGNSWMNATLQAFVSLPFINQCAQLCAISKMCSYCRLNSLKCRMLNTVERGKVFISYEFTEFFHGKDLKLITEAGKDFIFKLLNAVTVDENTNHNGHMFKDRFWFSCLLTPGDRCPKHQFGKELVIYFSHECVACATCHAYFPFDTHENLIFRIEEGMKYPENLVIQGRLFELQAAVAQDIKEQCEYYAYCKHTDVWKCYHDSSINAVTIVNIVGNPKVCIVMYSLKSEARTNVTPSKHFYKYEDVKHAKQKMEAVTENENILKIEYNENLVESETKPVIGDAKPEILKRFTNRRLANSDNFSSCINAVLQSLIQTQLCNVEGRLCSGSINCYYCRMVSFIRRFMANDDVTTAYDFTLFKSEFGIHGDKEGDPAVYISDLLNEIMFSERVNHTSSMTKHKFMIRFQKTSCSCGSNFKVYHWPVSPAKRNVSLDDLMTKFETLCTKCNKMTDLEPLYMPENLVITISNDKCNAEASVHYPVEWTFQAVRYFLSSVIVCNEKSKHHFTYCKSFGKWRCYDDTEVTEASVFDIQGKVRVLLYVTRELTDDVLKYGYNSPKKFYRYTDTLSLL